MKKDLITYGLLAIIGAIVAYFVCNLFLPEFSETSFKTLTSVPSSSLTAPNPEIFNFRAINPTVEANINCQNYNLGDTCDDLESSSSDDESDFMDYYFSSGDSDTDIYTDTDALFEEETFEEETDDGDFD